MLQQKSIIEPDLTQVLVNFKQDMFSTLNCVKIGQIQDYDATTQTARVQILFKRILPDGTIQSYQPLVDVPVFVLQGGGAALQMPVQAGDQGILLFSDRCIDQWLQNGGEASPIQGRMHHLSDAILLVGVNANTNVFSAAADQVILSYQGQKIRLNSTGIALIGAGGAEIDLVSEIITLKNTSTTLLTLINNLVTAILALQVTGPLPLTPAAITAITAAGEAFATLLL